MILHHLQPAVSMARQWGAEPANSAMVRAIRAAVHYGRCMHGRAKWGNDILLISLSLFSLYTIWQRCFRKLP